MLSTGWVLVFLFVMFLMDKNSFVLHARAKRGRGAIGSRMDEPGPYLSSTSLDHDGQPLHPDVRVKEEWERRVLCPEKPSFLNSHELLEDDADIKVKADDSCTSKKHHSKEKRLEDKKSRKTKRKEKRSKHHHKSRRRQ